MREGEREGGEGVREGGWVREGMGGGERVGEGGRKDERRYVMVCRRVSNEHP